MMTTVPIDLTLSPPADRWAALVRRRGDARSLEFRRELGLPVDRPVVMTGHQATFWHPGILAKYLAAGALAGRTGAACAWVVVDQDRATSAVVRYPALGGDGGLCVRTVDLAAPDDAVDAAATCVAAGLATMRRALAGTPAGAPLAERIGLATRGLFDPLLSAAQNAPVLLATRLGSTALFRALVERMGAEPERCIGAYNAAAARHASSGIRLLLADPVQDRWELPLWRIAPDGERHRVYAEDLAGDTRDRLAPKALFMTGLLRLAGCDLFIHGTGGGGGGAAAGDEQEGYDLVTQEWLHAWLGGEAADLAPITVATATMTLPLEVPPAPTRREVAHAVWLAHHARHNPLVLGDTAHEQQRVAALARLRAAARPERAHFFRELTRVLDGYRQSRMIGLMDLEDRAAAARARLGDVAILADRTWPFPLYPQRELFRLRDAIHGAFGGGAAAAPAHG
jgi:hypothetical protein